MRKQLYVVQFIEKQSIGRLAKLFLGVFIAISILTLPSQGKSKKSEKMSSGEKIVFDVDLTKGNAGPGKVIGGKWEKGWRITEDKEQRIVFDAGRSIKEGYIEATFTMAGDPNGTVPGKTNWFGIHEKPELDQAVAGDILYLRHETNKKLKVKAFIGEIVATPQIATTPDQKIKTPDAQRQVLEKAWGVGSDFIKDDKTPMTVKLEWKDGTMTFYDFRGQKIECLDECRKGVNSLRYLFLGGDNYGDNWSLKGARFLRVKLVETSSESKAKLK
jgi:hypothetical protein